MSKDHNKPGDAGADDNSPGSGLDGLPKDAVVPLPPKVVDDHMDKLANDQIEHYKNQKKKKGPAIKPN